MSERALLVAAGGGIGDTMLASMVASALRSRFHSVDAIVYPAHVDALTHGADVDEIFAATRSTSDLVAQLRPKRYAAAVVTWATPRNAAIPLLARIPVRVGQARRSYSRAFTHRVTVRSETGDRTTHWSEILLDYARAIGCDTDLAWPRFAVREDEREGAAALLRELGVEGEYVVLHPVCAAAPRRPVWPLEPWREIATRAARRFDVRVLVSGGLADRRIAAAVAEGTGATSIAGRTSIGELAALARGARALVAMHSGPMHVAAAVGTPTVGIFPLRVDFPDRWRPLGRAVAVVRNAYPCPPGRAHRMETCTTYACIERLDVDGVESALDEVIVRPRPSLRAGLGR